MTTYELLSEIASKNPTLTHFILRLYKHSLNPFVNKKDDFEYHFLSVGDLVSIQSIVTEYEKQGWMVGLTSMVMTTRGIQALLLLDFSITRTEEAQKELVEKITTFHGSGDISYSLEGWVIGTNNSFHYLGLYITSLENYRHFLGASLLFRHKDQKQFVVDDRWIGHQLKQGYGAIRIGNKEGNDTPKVIVRI